MATKARERGHWAEEQNRRAFLVEFAEERGIKKAADWKGVTYDMIAAAGGKGLLAKHGTVAQALQELGMVERGLDEAEYRPQRRRGYWVSVEKKRDFVEEVARKLGLPADRSAWNTITAKTIAVMGGSALLRQHRGSVLSLLKEIYPEEEWKPSKISPYLPRGHWESEENRKEFISRVEAHFDIRSPSDWSSVTKKDLLSLRGGGSLLARYGTVRSLLESELTLSESEKDERILRPQVSAAYWSDERNVRRFIHYAGRELGVREKDDWYRVSRKQLVALRGATLLEHMTFFQALSLTFPDERWDRERLEVGQGKKASQRRLFSQLGVIFDYSSHESPLSGSQ